MVWRSDAFNTTSFFTHILYHNITVTLRWGYFVTVGVTLWHHEFLGILNLPPQKKGSGKLKLLFQILAPVLAFLAPFWGRRFKIQKMSWCHNVTSSYGILILSSLTSPAYRCISPYNMALSEMVIKFLKWNILCLYLQ